MRMNVADHLLARLADEGITHAFIVYGGAISEIMDAFTRQNRIKYVVTIHEQAASFAAEGYAQTSGKPGLAIGTSGPGGQNMVTGIANCYYNSVPCVFITGQVQSRFMRPSNHIRQLGFQETPIVDIVHEITKYAGTIREPGSFSAILDYAIDICKTGRPGPILLDIPGDMAKCSI